MTRKEAIRQTDQENVLTSLGFTREEAEALRRISMTLHRWHEGECGSDSRCLTRGRIVDGEFVHDESGDAYWECSGTSGRNRYVRTADRERGAMRRLEAIMHRVNDLRAGGPLGNDSSPLEFYVQTDPRGAALYILRPGDVPPGENVESCYSRGICVY